MGSATFDTLRRTSAFMELRMPVGYPGAAVGGGDALDGKTFFALDAPQQRAMVAFWTAPGEFLVRVTHPALVKWLAVLLSFSQSSAALSRDAENIW